MFLVFTSRFEGKIHTKEGLHRIWSKIFTRLLPHSEFVWSRLRKRPPAQVFVSPSAKHTTLAPCQVLYCSIRSCDQIANSSFVVLNASILRKYRGKPSLRSASFQHFIELFFEFSLKRYRSKSALLKSVLSVQIDPLLDHILCSTSIEKKSDHVR